MGGDQEFWFWDTTSVCSDRPVWALLRQRARPLFSLVNQWEELFWVGYTVTAQRIYVPFLNKRASIPSDPEN